jgi:hypothetical protein
VKYLGLEFAYDELMAMREALGDTPTAKLLTLIVAKVRNDAKVDLQRSVLTLDELRNRQGVIEGMNKFKDIVNELLKFDVEELMKSKVEQSDEVEEEEDGSIYDF